jgi:hypothetical protein
MSPWLRQFASKLASYWRDVLFVLASLMVTYLVLEIGYRAYHYWTLPGRLFQLVAAEIPADYDQLSKVSRQYLPDQHTGYV